MTFLRLLLVALAVAGICFCVASVWATGKVSPNDVLTCGLVVVVAVVFNLKDIK